MKQLTLILSLLLIAVPWRVRAQGDVIALGSIEEAFALATSQNHDLTIYQLQQQKASSDLRNAQSAYLPKVSASATGQHNFDLATTPFPEELGIILGQPGQSVNVQFGTPYNFNAGINIAQTLFDWSAIQRMRMGKLGRQVSAAETEAFRQNLNEQVALSYYTALIAEEAIRVSRQDLEIADSILQITEEKFGQGLIDQSVVNQARINLNQLQQNAASTQILKAQSLHQLKLLLGVGAEQDLVLGGNVGLEELGIEPVLNEDKNLRVISEQLRRSEMNVNLQQGALMPRLSLYSYLGKQQFREDLALSFSEGAWTNFTYAGLDLSVPIFTGFSTSSKIKSARLDLEVARTRREKEEASSQIRDRLLLQEYQNGLVLARAARDNMDLSEQNSRLALQKLDQGVIGLDAYFRSFDDYLKAENAYLNALSQLYSHYATIISRK
jgi:outer membrane protein